jgi:hypothetical protein
MDHKKKGDEELDLSKDDALPVRVFNNWAHVRLPRCRSCKGLLIVLDPCRLDGDRAWVPVCSFFPQTRR